MNRKCYSLMLGGMLILLLLSACGTNASPTTNHNSSSVETALASTARALARQTETAQGFTPTPPVVPTITYTPTPRISVYGTSLVIQEDGSALFVDQIAGIQLIIPAGWMPIRVSEQEYYDAFTQDVVLNNQPIWDHLTAIQDVEQEWFRLDAIDIREGHIYNDVPTYMNVIFEKGDKRTLEQWAQVEGNRKKPFKNFKTIGRSYPKLEDGTRVLVLDQSWSSGTTETVFFRAVFISLPNGTLVLDLYTNKTLKDTVLPDFEAVLNGLKRLEP